MEHEKLRKLGFKNTYYSSLQKSSSRGVAIWLSNRLNFQFSSQITDKEVCYLLVKGLIYYKEITLVNVYRPAGGVKALIKKVFNMITVEASSVSICAGD